jgi:hypothetical protein
MTSRPIAAAPILAALAIVLVMLGGYVGGYLWLGEYDPGATVIYASGAEEPLTLRSYKHASLAILFYPAAVTESLMTGTNIDTCVQD